MTLREAILEAASRFAKQPDLRIAAVRDAEQLLLHVLGAPRTLLFTEPSRSLTDEEHSAYSKLVARRLTCEPMQYITGKQEFYGLPLRVSPAVLIPRPETELLVETALQLLPKDRPLNLVAVGTGSGAIAIAVAKNLPLAQVTALDVSPAALMVARENASAHGLLGRMHFAESDLLRGVPAAGTFDAVLSNPPYVPAFDRDGLHPEVRDHEPSLALFAGADGMDVYTRLVPQAFYALTPAGLLVLELGYGQREAVAALLTSWEQVEFRNDLQGIPRVLTARTPG